MSDVTLLHGDCLDVLKTLEDCSVEAVVTDPLAGIAFMNAAWDGDKGGRDQWIAWLSSVMAEALRVTKPGGHALVWALPRTSHWTATALEDAGWEIRDCITHLYGSGFPKSLSIDKAIERSKVLGDTRLIYQATVWIHGRCQQLGLKASDLDRATGTCMGNYWTTHPTQPSIPTAEQWAKLEPLLGEPPEWLRQLIKPAFAPSDAWSEREVIGQVTKARSEGGKSALPTLGSPVKYETWNETAPATDAARQWAGWGSALKPATEHWWLCRKPLIGTVAANVQAFGTGALNIAATRVSANVEEMRGRSGIAAQPNQIYGKGVRNPTDEIWEPHTAGRWPPNAVLVHSSGCVRTGTARVRGSNGVRGASTHIYGGGKGFTSATGEQVGYADPDGRETVETYACTPDCPVRILGEQSGERVSKWGKSKAAIKDSMFFGPDDGTQRDACNEWVGDKGTAARFFPQFTQDPDLDAPFLYCSKASKRERNAGLDSASSAWRCTCGALLKGHDATNCPPKAGNGHPCVKPIALMAWLCRLITPPGGTVLDPFMGSGSTGCAAVREGFNFIGIEREEEYLNIAKARISHVEQQARQPALPMAGD